MAPLVQTSAVILSGSALAVRLWWVISRVYATPAYRTVNVMGRRTSMRLLGCMRRSFRKTGLSHQVLTLHLSLGMQRSIKPGKAGFFASRISVFASMDN